MVAISDVLDGITLDTELLALMLIIIVMVSISAYFTTIYLGDRILPLLVKINYRWLCLSVLTGLTILVLIFTGWFGLVVYAAAIPVGMLAPYLKVRRTHAMGVLMLPLLMFYF